MHMIKLVSTLSMAPIEDCTYNEFCDIYKNIGIACSGHRSCIDWVYNDTYTYQTAPIGCQAVELF